MSSREGPAEGPDEGVPIPGVMLPEGPLADWLVSPAGPGAALAVGEARLRARRLRLARPQPFGFSPDAPHPMPEGIGDVSGGGIRSVLAAALGQRTEIPSLSISYGDFADTSAPAARVFSDFGPQAQEESDLDDALRDAMATWLGHPIWPVSQSRAETTAADAEIVLCGARRVVTVLHLAEFSAFEARHQDARVTVIARHMGSEFPEIVRLTDLEPMLSPLEHLDRATAAAAMAEERRQTIERMRNHAPGSPDPHPGS